MCELITDTNLIYMKLLVICHFKLSMKKLFWFMIHFKWGTLNRQDSVVEWKYPRDVWLFSYSAVISSIIMGTMSFFLISSEPNIVPDTYETLKEYLLSKWLNDKYMLADIWYLITISYSYLNKRKNAHSLHWKVPSDAMIIKYYKNGKSAHAMSF